MNAKFIPIKIMPNCLQDHKFKLRQHKLPITTLMPRHTITAVSKSSKQAKNSSVLLLSPRNGAVHLFNAW